MITKMECILTKLFFLVATLLTGRAIDGYLSNCTVFIDVNGDGKPGINESVSVTDSFGGFVLLAGAPGVSAGTSYHDARHLIRHIVYRCSPCLPPHSVPVLATSYTSL